MDYYSTGYFSEIGIFLKMAITQKVLVGISSNFLHSIYKYINMYTHRGFLPSLPSGLNLSMKRN